MLEVNESELVGVNGKATARKGRAESVHRSFTLTRDRSTLARDVLFLRRQADLASYVDATERRAE